MTFIQNQYNKILVAQGLHATWIPHVNIIKNKIKLVKTCVSPIECLYYYFTLQTSGVAESTAASLDTRSLAIQRNKCMC